MQIQFDPMKLADADAAFIFGLALGAMVKTAKADGQSREELQGLLAAMLETIWPAPDTNLEEPKG